jgi:thioredoxin-related protein
LDSRALSNKIVVEKIQSDYHYERVEYDSSEGEAFMERYQLSGFPDLIVLDQNGEEIERLPRSFSPETLLGSL